MELQLWDKIHGKQADSVGVISSEQWKSTTVLCCAVQTGQKLTWGKVT
jgi:hypothetical protein